MDLSKAKGLYVGNALVKYAWFNGRRVWPSDEHDNIGILLTDGSIIPYSQTADSYPKEEVVGVTYADNMAQFCIALDDLPKSYWAGRGVLPNDPEGVVVSSLSTQAVQDIRGKSNTDILAPLLQGTGWAVHVCRNHLFPDGSPGYLGALGEYYAIIKNITVINELLAKCSGTPISTTVNYWSSTLNNYDSDNSSRIVWIWSGSGYVDGANCQGMNLCRPLCEYNPDRTDNDLDVTLVDAWIFSGHDNSEAPTEIVGEKGIALNTHNFAWNEEGSGFKDGALHFDGYDDYLDCGKTPVLTEYTLIMKRTYSKFGAYACVASKYYDYNRNGAFLFELNYINAKVSQPNQTWSYSSATEAGAKEIAQEDIPELISWQTSDSYNGKINLGRGSATDGVYFAIGSRRGATEGVTAMSCYWCALYSKSLTEEQIQKEIQKLETLWNSRLNNNKETSK